MQDDALSPVVPGPGSAVLAKALAYNDDDNDLALARALAERWPALDAETADALYEYLEAKVSDWERRVERGDPLVGSEVRTALIAWADDVDNNPDAWREAEAEHRPRRTYEEQVAWCDGFQGRPLQGPENLRAAYRDGLRDRHPGGSDGAFIEDFMPAAFRGRFTAPRARGAGRPGTRRRRASSNSSSRSDPDLGESPREPPPGVGGGA